MDTHQSSYTKYDPVINTSPSDNIIYRDGDGIHQDHRAKLKPNLSKFTITVLVLTFAICLGCLAFLTFLWAADAQNDAWRNIVVSGWTTRSITISALALRWATAFQAILCTSMLAAILLQSGTVTLPNAAAVSILRYDNTGPWSLLNTMKAEWQIGSIWIGVLAIMLGLTTLALQFTSTVLLSQVGLGSIPVESYVAYTSYGADDDGTSFASQTFGTSQSYLFTTPTGFPAFAEWVSNAMDDSAQYGEFAPNSGPGIRDTGTVIRAFLPIKDVENRSRMAEYTGFGTAVDTRVVCMRPTLTDVVYSTGSGYRLTGTANVNPDEEPLGLFRQPYEGSNDYSLSFDCGFSAISISDYDEESYGWPLALCQGIYWESKQGIFSVMQSEGQEELGKSWLLLNATMIEAVTELEGSDVWESMSLQSNDSSNAVSIQLTLCMTTFEAQQMEIRASRPTPIPAEPALSWNALQGVFRTDAVRQQLGAGSPSLSITERGLFDLAPRTWEWPARPEFVSLTGGTFSTTAALDMIHGQDDIYGGFVNNAQYSILAQTASFTANPALALQAYFTTMCAIAYYDRIIMFDTSAPSTQVNLVQVTQPLVWTAYIAVAIVLGLHLLLVLFAILLFYRIATFSRVGNAWAAVSQLLGPSTESWIRDADMVDDKTVKQWLKSYGLHETVVRVEDVQGRVHFVKKTKVS